MKAPKKIIAVSILLGLTLISGTAYASDIAVTYSLLTKEDNGVVIKGTIRVEVRNLTNRSLHNVDLRLAHPGPNFIEKGLFQFGSIPSGETRVVSGGFLFEKTSGAPIMWKVDYDDSTGAHRQVILP